MFRSKQTPPAPAASTAPAAAANDKVWTGPVDLGDEFPEFYLHSQLGPISLHAACEGKWGCVVTFRKAFEPVSTTDLGMLAKMNEEFEARKISVIAVGHDDVANIRSWVADIEEIHSIRLKFPVVSDPDCTLLRKIGCARPDPRTGIVSPMALGVFLVDLSKSIRLASRYSCAIGRNLYEILRAYDALLITTHHRVVCPSNWGMGQEVLLSDQITQEEANHFRFAEIKPYFRLTPCPET